MKLSNILNKKYIKNIFADNITAKVICFVVAIILWFFVASSQGILGKVPGEISIKTINVSEGLVAVYDEKTVEIQIMADPTDWRQISSNSFNASVDLAGLSEGTYELEVSVVSSVPDIKIVRKSPQKIIVSLERVISKKVNINSRIEGDVAEGLVAGNIELTPQEVEAIGPSSTINDLTEATIIIKLNGESDNFDKIAQVKAFSEKGEELKSVIFKPEEVSAKVSVVQASNNKTVGVKVNTSGSLQEGYYISKITTIPNTVDVTGPFSALQKINYIETATVDLSAVSNGFEKDVVLIVPSGIGLQRGVSNRVRVIILTETGNISRTITATISIVNLESDIKIVSYSPSQINVLVSGNQSQINSLLSSEVKIEINLSGKKAGRHDFEISTQSVLVPQGVGVDSILPSVISVVLESK